jgi:putative ABC transport system permease protein
MSLLDSLWTGICALRANPIRTALTMLGIVIGVAAVICMLSIGMGAQYDVAEKIRTLGSNLLLVKPGAQISDAARLGAGTAHTLTEDDASAIRHEVEGVEAAAPLLSQPEQLIAGDRNWSSLVAGINRDYLIAREWRIESGRTFNVAELDHADKVAIVGSDIVEQLFDGRSALGATLRIGKVPFTIIAVLGKKGLGPAGISQDDVVFVPLSAAKSRILGSVHGDKREAMDFILVKTVDQQLMPDVTNAIAVLLRQRHHLVRDAPDDFSVQNPAEVLTARMGAVDTFTILLISVASVSLAVGGISIMNIMLVSVTERTREIGVRMAVGARRRDIHRQFLAEAVVLALVSGLVGSLVGCAAAALIAWRAGWPVIIGPMSMLLACGFAGGVGVAFGVYPAYRASHLDPIAALRCE